jgi:hypothetical protein
MGLKEYYLTLCSGWAIRVDTKTLFFLPAAVMAPLFVLTLWLRSMGATQWQPIAPLAVAAVVISSWLCVRAGCWSGVLVMVLHYAGDWIWGESVTGDIVADGLVFLSMFAGILLVAPRNRDRPPPQRGIADTDPLPFTSSRREGEQRSQCFWDVQPVGDWDQDCNVGTAYEEVYGGRVQRGAAFPMFSWILEDMIKTCAERGEKFSGIEAGFANALMARLQNHPRRGVG